MVEDQVLVFLLIGQVKSQSAYGSLHEACRHVTTTKYFPYLNKFLRGQDNHLCRQLPKNVLAFPPRLNFPNRAEYHPRKQSHRAQPAFCSDLEAHSCTLHSYTNRFFAHCNV